MIPILEEVLGGSTDLNDWLMASETRTSGADAVNITRYYVDPKTRQGFRSEAEVKDYLETRSKDKSHYYDANETPSEKRAKTEKSSKYSEAKQAKRSRKETLDLLPAGWTVTTKTRTTGVTAGTVDRTSGAGAENTDRYYVDPTGQRFRSKIEVKRFLETGSKNKSLSGANATPCETTGKDKKKSGTKMTSTKRNKEGGRSCEEITWTLED